jgi:hypothetical protein
MNHHDSKCGPGPAAAVSRFAAGASSRNRNLRNRIVEWAGAGVLLSLLAATGCSVHYDVLLNNGDAFTAYSKPMPDGHGRLVFKNKDGEQVSVSEHRVLEIRAK